ncbi:asparagine synthase-related protein [Solimonas sp. SE-A11]|uniref:asparagine synthase-related protein n=1 Tax=Solimonas sp. SE-A11 TaxID=3054954 RepID=UPI00259C978A|nr:asparagine synthase-related protein [Solimonas sp. SE-A11]MDM4772316.1 asparagine synthase-related protein [Solimonas sp. SE-A11]
MSGIAGVVGLEGAPQSQELLERMVAARPPRPADGAGHWHAGPALMIRCHRPVTPESPVERQCLHPGPFEDFSGLSDADHVDRFNELFDQALASSLRSATPVAAQLSDGRNSSAMVYRATELHRAGRIAHPVTAISAWFPDRVHDEAQWSECVESHLSIEARTVMSGPDDLEQAEAWTARLLQLPLHRNASHWSITCEALCRQGTRVVLTGEGGDD